MSGQWLLHRAAQSRPALAAGPQSCPPAHLHCFPWGLGPHHGEGRGHWCRGASRAWVDLPCFTRSRSPSGRSSRRSWSRCCIGPTACRRSSGPPSRPTACCWTWVSRGQVQGPWGPGPHPIRGPLHGWGDRGHIGGNRAGTRPRESRANVLCPYPLGNRPWCCCVHISPRPPQQPSRAFGLSPLLWPLGGQRGGSHGGKPTAGHI